MLDSINSRRSGRLLAIAAATALAAGGFAAGPASAADTAGLPQATLTWAGESGGTFGTAASRDSCDVNGDGKTDALIGDWGWDRPEASNVGAAYVLMGSDELDSGEIGDPADSGAIRIDGPAQAAQALIGWSVSCLGDVNGDGIDDLVVGSGSRSHQEAYVILGRKDFSNVDLDFLGADGFVIADPNANDKSTGDKSSDNFGIGVGAVGDVNGDGLADIGIVDMLADNNDRTNSGRVWIISGSKSVKNVDLSDEDQRNDRVIRTIDGSKADERLGTVSNAGDVNGDGIDDFAMSSYTGSPWGSDVAVAGAAYAVFGQRVAGGVDLSTLGEEGFAVYGPTRQRDRLGMSIAAAGDINGDGLADLVIGADGVSSTVTGERNGGAAIVYGSTSTATVMTAPGTSGYSVFSCEDAELDLTCASSAKVSRGYWINGAANNDKIGYAVASLPDVNGDGIRDIVLGGQGRSTWLVYGDPTQKRTVELADATAGTAVQLGTGFGAAVGNAGDLDGNGTADVISGGGNKATVFLLGALKTKTTLESAADTKFGRQVSFTASVTTRVPSVEGSQSGKIGFAANGTAIEGCQDLAVSGNTPVSCSTTVTWTAGKSAVSATFTPDGNGFAASDASTALVVEKRDTQVRTVALSAVTATYGTGTVKATATVKNLTEGQVEFISGKRVLGTAAVTAAGTATLTLPKDLAIGEHTIVARYLATANHNASPRTAADDSLTVKKSATSVAAPVLGTVSGTYGKAVSASATVKGATSGKVEFRSGIKLLGSSSVGAGGKATLSLSKSLAPGKYKITAKFLGNTTAAASTVSTTSKQLTVAKAKLTAKTKVSAPAVKKNAKPTLTVTLGKLNNGSYPTGKILVTTGSWKGTATVKASHQGVIKVVVNKKFTKKATIAARYQGNATTAAGAKATTVVKISK